MGLNMSFAANFKAGTDIASELMAAFQTARQQRDMAEIANAAPEQSQGFTAEQGDQLTAAANSGQYDIGYDEAKKAYTVTPKADPSQTGAIAQQGVTDFMGKRTAGAMSDDQIRGARQMAAAGLVSKTDPITGMRMEREARQGEQADQRFAWEKSRNERDIRMAGEQDAETSFSKELDSSVGDWFKGRLKNPDGTERAATVDDHLASSQFRAAKLAQAGRMEQAGKAMQDYGVQSMAKIHLEGAQRDQALGKTAAALAAGNLDAVKDFYNQFIPDGSRVTDVKRGTDGAIVIQRETMDGRTMPETVLKDAGQLAAALSAFKDPMALYNWSQNEFKNTLATNADKRADKQLDETLRHNKVSEGLSYAAHKDQSAVRADAASRAAAGVALYKEQNPGATTAQLEAVRTGIISAVPTADKNAPSEVKLAKAMVEAGLAPDMKTGIEMAVTKKSQAPSEMHKEFVAANLKNYMKPADAVKSADDVMATMGFKKSGNSWANGPDGGSKAAKPTSQADAQEQARAAVSKGANKDAVNKRLKEMGFPEI